MNTRRTRHPQKITSPQTYDDVGKGRVAVNIIAKTSVKEQDEVKETEAKSSQISSSSFPQKQDSTSKKTETVRSVLRVKVDLEDDKPMKKGVRSVKKRKVQQDSAAIEPQTQTQRPDGRTKANDFPPGLATTISCGLFGSKEPQTVANLLQKMLFVQNIVPPLDLVEKLMNLLKYGPKSEGSSVYFKDPLHTELASSYAYALVKASSRLVRKDDSALFGPSSWDDVEIFLSQSIDQTENAISGRRLAQGLHMAACGAKLLSLMLKTELLKSNFSSSANFSFRTLSMKLMPTVKVLKTEGLRNALKAVVRHTTKCLVRHSKWILDHDLNELSSIERASAECCAAEAKTCFDCLGSVLCYTAWLYCAEEGIEINHPNCAFVIKDEFLSELTRYIEKLPEMSSRKKTTHIKKLKWYFILSFVEEFASSLQDSVGKMIGLEDLLDCFKVETTAMTQMCDDVSDSNLASSCPSQFVRKSDSAVMVLRREAFVEAYELKKQDSGLYWVQYVSDGKCEAVASEKIFRSRQSNRKARLRFGVKDSFNLRPAKSSRYLTGEKLKPLNSNIIQDDLSQMEAYDVACKAFRIRSSLPCNSESMKSAQSDTDLLSPQTILTTHSVLGRPPSIPDASDPCASDPEPRPILHPRFNHPEKTSFVPMEYCSPGCSRINVEDNFEECVSSTHGNQSFFSPASAAMSVPLFIQQLDRNMEIVASNFLEKNSGGGESMQSCRYCRQKFFLTADGLTKHEVSCPIGIQIQQLLQERNELQQNIGIQVHALQQQLQLQHNPLQQQFQQQQLNFDHLCLPMAPSQEDAMALRGLLQLLQQHNALQQQLQLQHNPLQQQFQQQQLNFDHLCLPMVPSQEDAMALRGLLQLLQQHNALQQQFQQQPIAPSQDSMTSLRSQCLPEVQYYQYSTDPHHQYHPRQP